MSSRLIKKPGKVVVAFIESLNGPAPTPSQSVAGVQPLGMRWDERMARLRALQTGAEFVALVEGARADGAMRRDDTTLLVIG